MMRMSLLAMAVVALSGMNAHAATIAFDMTDNGEGLALENTGSATKSGVTMTATSNATINAISTRLGINSAGSSDESSQFDDANGDNTGTEETFTMSFDVDLTLDSIDFSGFGTDDRGSITIGAGSPTTIDGSSDNTNPLSVGQFITAGTTVQLAYVNNTGGNGWGIETVTVTPIPTPAALPAGLAMLGLIGMRRRRR